VHQVQFTAPAECHKLSNQSKYCRHRKTEDALVSIMNDVIHGIDLGEVTALALLDLSAEFDALHRRFAVDGIQQVWFQSYLA